MIHISQLHKLVQQVPEFSFVFVEKNGEKLRCEHCICTSWHSKGRTMNVKWMNSGEIRKIRRVSIIEFNGQKVVL